MTVRIRAVALFVALFTSGVVAAGTDPSAPRTPQEVMGFLKAGNDRFARNASVPVSLSSNRRRELADAERPMAMVLSCADSRVPPEFIFNAGLGDLLVIRTAGEVVDRSVLATVEYGADTLRIPMLVVMGHESCSVVKTAVDAKTAAPSPNLDYLIKAIQASRKPTTQERDEVKTLVLANVEQVINDAMAKSPMLQRLVDEGRLGIVGAYYEMVSGRVIFSEPVTQQSLPSQAKH